MQQRKFGIQLLTKTFNQIALTKEFKKYEPWTHSYQHNLDDESTNVLFEKGAPEKEIVAFFKEQIANGRENPA